MASISNDKYDTGPDEYFGILDVFVVIAESWKLLIAAGLLGAAVAFGYYYLLPQSFESKAIVQLTATDAVVAATPAFFSQVGLDEPRQSQFSLVRGNDSGNGRAFYTLSWRDQTAAAAQGGLQKIVDTLAPKLKPSETEMQVLQLKKTRLVAALQELSDISKHLSVGGETIQSGSESELYARAVILLLDEQTKQRAELLQVEREMAASLEAMTVQAPTLPTKSDRTSLRHLLVIGAGLAIIGALVFAFAREIVHRQGQTKNGAQKLARIRRAFSFVGK